MFDEVERGLVVEIGVDSSSTCGRWKILGEKEDNIRSLEGMVDGLRRIGDIM